MPKLKLSPEENRNHILQATIVCNQPVNFNLMDIHALSQYLKFTPVQAASIAFGCDITAKEAKDFILM